MKDCQDYQDYLISREPDLSKNFLSNFEKNEFLDSAKNNWEEFLMFIFNSFPHISADMAIKLKQLLDDSQYKDFFSLKHMQSEPPIVEDSSLSKSFYHFQTDGSTLKINLI